MGTERKNGYRPVNYRWFNRLVRWSFGLWLKKAYRIKAEGAELFETLEPPYVLVANHVATRDPFWISVHIPDLIYWVSSDGNMRTRLMRAALRLVGTIPKSKAIPDIETVNHIVEVVRKRRGVIGLFPEGTQTWDGRTLPLYTSTAKLLKLLKVPVVAVTISGGYFALPRWTWKRRSGQVRLSFKRILEPAELKALSAEEIFSRLEEALRHDEFAVQGASPVAFHSRRRAEHLELSLYMCPFCKGIGSLRSSKNQLRCAACGEGLGLDRFYRLRRIGGGGLPVKDIPSWDAWQSEEMRSLAAKAVAEGDPRRLLFSDQGALLLKGRRMNPLRRIRTGTLVMYPDRMELATLLGERLVFPLSELEALGVLRRNLFEFYRGRHLYQLRFPLRSISARKWAETAEVLKELAAEATGS